MSTDLTSRYREAIEALGRHDLDALLEHYGDGVVATDHAQQRRIEGKDAYRAWCEEWLGAAPDSTVEELDCFGAGELTVARFTSRGTNTGPMGPFEATDQPMRLALCSIARWRDGAIIEEDIYYDMYGVLTQLGHAPALAPAG